MSQHDVMLSITEPSHKVIRRTQSRKHSPPRTVSASTSKTFSSLDVFLSHTQEHSEPNNLNFRIIINWLSFKLWSRIISDIKTYRIQKSCNGFKDLLHLSLWWTGDFNIRSWKATIDGCFLINDVQVAFNDCLAPKMLTVQSKQTIQHWFSLNCSAEFHQSSEN